jgi:cytochrome c553
MVRNLKRVFVVFALSSAVWATACGGIAEVEPAAAGSAGVGTTASVSSAGASAIVGDATRGEAVYQQVACYSCHGQNAAGNGGPNITPSKTAGIGAWTYQQFHDAVRFGKAPNGSTLCAFMVPFFESDLSERSIQDVYAFLNTKPAVDVVNKGTYCP